MMKKVKKNERSKALTRSRGVSRSFNEENEGSTSPPGRAGIKILFAAECMFLF